VDVSEMQKKLSQWATENPTERRRDLYSLLCNAVWLRAAHRSVNTNQGRETAGIDGESMRDFNRDLEANLEALRQQLKAKTFEPLPVRRVDIPKANGKTRSLGIPDIRDRIVQEALRMILEPIWEAEFSIHSYQLDTLRQQREAAAGQAAAPPLPPVPPVSPPTDLQALIQQAVQQALAAQAAASKGQLSAPSQAPDPTPPALQDGWCTRHQVAMERRSNAKGTWLSHWLAAENRWCRGK
jgi:hypothetical protein